MSRPTSALSLCGVHVAGGNKAELPAKARHCAQLVGEAFGGVSNPLSNDQVGADHRRWGGTYLLGEAEGQFIFADGMGYPLGIIIDGEGLTPVALTAEDRVA